MLKMAVLAKQVPDTKHVIGDVIKPDGTLNRAALRPIFNPEDLHALELALQIKDRVGGHVTVISMGPSAAATLLRDALSRGADAAVLVSDKAFAGSDTLATSVALAAAVRRLAPVDVVLGGRQAIDGDTAQVGPQTAEKLGWPQLTYVEEIREISNQRLGVFRRLGRHAEHIEIKLPVLLTVTPEAGEPRPPRVRRLLKYARARTAGELRAELTAAGVPADQLDARLREAVARHQAEGTLIPVWTVDDLGVQPALVGLEGSPTKVKRCENVILKTGEYKKIDATEDGARLLIDELVHDHILG
jgi:electron transfer flavoprotein beta subunit